MDQYTKKRLKERLIVGRELVDLRQAEREHEGPWRNYWIFNGGSYWGSSTYQTQQQAHDRAAVWLRECREYRDTECAPWHDFHITSQTGGKLCLFSQIKFYIPMPVKS